MNLQTLIALYLSATLVLSCTQPKPPAGEAVLDLSADDAFVKAANYLQRNGFLFDQFDRPGHALSSQWKEIPAGEFAELATPKDSLDRYSRGRIRYKIRFSTPGDRTEAKVEAEIEGLLTPRQAGSENFGSILKYEAATSKGVAERSLIDDIAN